MQEVRYAMLPPEAERTWGLTPGRLYEATVSLDGFYSMVDVKLDSGETIELPKNELICFNKRMERVYQRGDHGRPFTQKARSIMACRRAISGVGLLNPPEHLHVVPGGINESRLKFPLFGRPCPTRPRHGFVDSKVVYSKEEVLDLLEAATRKDEQHDAELVLMPLLTGSYSAIATNAGVTWGRSNDGVTAGTDASAVTIPAFSTAENWMGAIQTAICPILNDPGRPSMIEDTPYIEIVEHEGYAHAVQMRDGPAQSGETDFIPRKTKVTRVLRPEGDLVAWEKIVHDHGGFPGVVIASEGMPLSSHYAVHGIERGIPVVTSRVPNEGETLYPTKGRPPRLTRSQLNSVRNEVVQLLEADSPFGRNWDDWEEVVPTAVATVHAQYQWGWKKHLLQLRAVSLVALLKTTLAACVGEMRHWWSRHGPGMEWDDDDENYNENGETPEWFPGHTYWDKTDLYRKMICPPAELATIEGRLNSLANSFDDSGWVRGYGGRNWATVARAGARLSTCLDEFIKDPSVANWRAAFNAANMLVNTVHNGGKCLTKITNDRTMDAIAQAPAVGFCNAFTGALLMDQLYAWRNRKRKDFTDG